MVSAVNGEAQVGQGCAVILWVTTVSLLFVFKKKKISCREYKVRFISPSDVR